MRFLNEMVNRPFSHWGPREQIVAIVIVVVAIFLVFCTVSVIRHIADRRGASREPLTNPVEITWEDIAGLPQHSQGRCLDFSAGGLRMELRDRVYVPARIKFRVLNSYLAGIALVRYCKRKGPKYVTGAEFVSLSQ